MEVVKRLGADGRPVAAGDGFDPARIYAREAPGIVTVLSTGLSGGGAGLGSGFVVSEEGEVATNAHVVTSGEVPQPARATAPAPASARPALATAGRPLTPGAPG